MPEPTEQPPVPNIPAESYAGRRRGHAGPGRNALINAEMIAEMENLVRAGNYIETVVDFLMIDRETFRNYQKRGKVQARRVRRGEPVEAGEELYFEWFNALRRAQAAAEMSDLANIGAVARGRPRSVRRIRHPDGTEVEEITEGMAPRWEASAWRLERRNRKRYGKTDSVNLKHSGDAEAPLQVQHSGRVQFYIPANGRGLTPDEEAAALPPMVSDNADPSDEG